MDAFDAGGIQPARQGVDRGPVGFCVTGLCHHAQGGVAGLVDVQRCRLVVVVVAMSGNLLLGGEDLCQRGDGDACGDQLAADQAGQFDGARVVAVQQYRVCLRWRCPCRRQSR